MRNYFALIALLFVILLLYSLSQQLSKPLTLEQAKAFVLQDVSSLNAESRFIGESSYDGKQWSFEVLVTTNAHSPCPTAERRLYTLPPVSFRPATFIDSCYPRAKIFYREEALIDSANSLGIKDGYGCAFPANADWFGETSYCPSLSPSEAAAFAEGLPADSWIVLWTRDGSSKLYALDVNGNLIR
jgi:hypothetical protein